MSGTERTGGIGNAINTIVNAFFDSIRTLFSGRIDYALGNYVHVEHPDTGVFNGHIAELPTEETVVVAREGDGVLVHVARDCINGVDNGGE